MKEGQKVKICGDEEAILSTSRAAGIAIDVEKDGLRAKCAGKPATIRDVDNGDKTVKLSVVTEPGKAVALWFGDSGVRGSVGTRRDMQIRYEYRGRS